MADLALEVDHVTKSFRLHHEKANSIKQLVAGKGRTRYDDFVALNDVSFDVKEGEAASTGPTKKGKVIMLRRSCDEWSMASAAA